MPPSRYESPHPEASCCSATREFALDIAVQAAVQQTGATAAAIALMENSVFVCRARLGDIAPDLGVALNVRTGITGTCVRTAQVLNCTDAQTDERVDADVCRSLGIRSIVVIPVLGNGVVTGVLSVLSVNARAFGPVHLQCLSRVATFVRDLTYGRSTTIAVPTRHLHPEPVLSAHTKKDTLGEPLGRSDSRDRSKATGEDTGLSAIREVVEQVPPASSWGDFCQHLLSQLEK